MIWRFDAVNSSPGKVDQPAGPLKLLTPRASCSSVPDAMMPWPIYF